jgi:uncharacterized repeat protein (TIGR01451 family)
VISSPLAITPTIALSAPVSAGLFVISSTLPGRTTQSAGAWSGALQAGMTLSWTFVATTSSNLAAGAPLTALLGVATQQPDIRFTRQSVVWVDTPHLVSSLAMQPAATNWNSIVTFTARMTNEGNIPAPTALLTAVVPTGLTLLTQTVQGPATGSTTLARNRIGWMGHLAGGASISLTYAVSVPAVRLPQRDFYHAVLVDDGVSALSQSALWISPGAQTRFLPVILR